MAPQNDAINQKLHLLISVKYQKLPKSYKSIKINEEIALKATYAPWTSEKKKKKWEQN